MPLRTIRIATRGSALALAQAQWVAQRCVQTIPGVRVDVQVIKTSGDQWQHLSLTDAPLPKGLFTKEIEDAVLRGEADLAVHSLKDLPTDLPPGLVLQAVTLRADVRDVLVRRIDDVPRLANLPPPDLSPLHQSILGEKATVATSSTRRSAQLREHRPDVSIVPIRGNVGTRLGKLAAQPDLDALILAAAGLERLGCRMGPEGTLTGPEAPPGLWARPIPVEEMLPCVGQAALGIEVRTGDQDALELCGALNHEPTRRCTEAERAFLKAMGGGCQLAVAAYAEVDGSQLRMRAVSFLHGNASRAEGKETMDKPSLLGERLATLLGGSALR